MGALFGGIADVFNSIGNIGADLPPAVREKAKKIVVSAIIVTQVATQAAAVATASASSSSSSSGRRKTK